MNRMQKLGWFSNHVLIALALVVAAWRPAAAAAQQCDVRTVRFEIAVAPNNPVPLPLHWRISSTCSGTSQPFGRQCGSNPLSPPVLPAGASALRKCEILRDDIARCSADFFQITYDGCADPAPTFIIRDMNANCQTGAHNGVAFGISNDPQVHTNQSGWHRDYELDLIYPGCANGSAAMNVLKCDGGVTSGVPITGATATIAAKVDLGELLPAGPVVTKSVVTTPGQPLNPAAVVLQLASMLNTDPQLSTRGITCSARAGGLGGGPERILQCKQVPAGNGPLGVSLQINDSNCAKANEAGPTQIIENAISKVDNPSAPNCPTFSTCDVRTPPGGGGGTAVPLPPVRTLVPLIVLLCGLGVWLASRARARRLG